MTFDFGKTQLLRGLLAAGALGVVLGTAGAAIGQEPPAPGPEAVAEPEPVTDGTPAPDDAADEGAPETVSFERKTNFDLTTEQRARFQQWLPKSYQKLSQRKPFHMVAVGDSIVEMFGYDENAFDWTKAYPAQFASALARQFFYTGGVRIIKPKKGMPDKEYPHLGPEITLRNLGRGGKLSIHGIQSLSTYGLENPPDLVTISFGINDSNNGLDPALYAKALQEAVNAVRSAGGEVILIGPSAIVENPPEKALGQTRIYADTMRDVAKESGVLFVDLGDLAPLVKVPAELSDPVEVFGAVVDRYRLYFDHADVTDYVHPRVELHAKLGRQVFDNLIEGATEVPWKISGGTATLLNSERIEVEWTLTNVSDEPLDFVVLPLLQVGWKPLEAAPTVTLGAGESKVMKVPYGVAEGALQNPMPSHEPLLRLPVMVTGARMVRIEDVRANLQPAVLLWKVEAQFNQEEEFVPANLLVNTTDKPLRCQWTATWMGKEQKGKIQVPPGGRKELPIRFKLPDFDKARFWHETKISVLLSMDQMTLRFDRDVHLVKNFGLKQKVPMTALDQDRAPTEEEMKKSGRSVVMRVDADNDNLFIVYELTGIELMDDPNSVAWYGEYNLDARSYGKRLVSGVTDVVRLFGSASDGPGTVRDMAPWVFGTGYAARFEEEHVKATLSSGKDGVRRITLTLPRSYMYMHEWALDNGNSQLGVHTSIGFWRPGEDGGPGFYPADMQFGLARHRHRDDVEGHAVLELTENPTRRWTISVD